MAGGLIVKHCLRKSVMPEGKFGWPGVDVCGSSVQDKTRNELENAGDSLQSNVDKAVDSAQDAGKDLRRQAESAGDTAQDTARDLQRDVKKGVSN